MTRHSNFFLLLLFLSIAWTHLETRTQVMADNQFAIAALESSEAVWRLLPNPKSGTKASLPTWARMLGPRLPLSTASLLELDLAHRTKSPVSPDLRAAMRFVIAQSNGCDYASQVAKFDLGVAGVPQSLQASLADATFTGWSTDQQNALKFARKMAVASHSVTDDEFQHLVIAFGDKQTASMVLLAAYGNMQDRLLICLGADAEVDAADGALAPIEVSFDPAAFKIERRHPPASEPTDLPDPHRLDSIKDEVGWSELSYDDLQQRLAVQRDKPTRLAIPDWDQVSKNLPIGMFDRPNDIVWYRIVFGYAPELAIPFERYMRTSGTETSGYYGRVFGTSLFWIVTRSVDCAYCMGHCEMNWEVAGLSLDQIAKRSQKLAGNDWSGFPAEQQRAFAFARKLSREPGRVTNEDLETLKQDHGSDTALSIVLHTSRYHYMTRISNGFQLKLESENVFFDYWNRPRPNAQSSSSTAAAVPATSDSATWVRLPKLSSGEQGPLPIWAKGLATQLPRTTAAMLELDYAQRVSSPLDAKLRAKMRWVIARANRCDYSQAYAMADLRRSGGSEEECELLSGESTKWPEEDREPLEFARLMTLAAPTIDDPMFARLKDRFGENRVAAMVLLAAYGNFQDRIVMGLRLRLSNEEPLAPLPVKFVDGALQLGPILPSERGADTYHSDGKAIEPQDENWVALNYDELQQRLEQQRDRTPRLPIPSWETVASKLPSAMAAKPTRIRWSLVNYGYAPELAIPWTIATRTHWAEAPAERILEESAFWIQTRAIQCNYCMGHCEMLLEEAGLDKSAIAHRTRLLAESDWGQFPVAEQRVYAYARKLSLTPWDLTTADYQTLVDEFGPQKAMGIFWWLCRGLYMTRISDGFQLSLERDNVFTHHGAVNAAAEDK